MDLKSALLRISLAVIVSLQAPSLSLAGQVVSAETREWARQVVKEEKALSTVVGKNTLAVLYFLNRTGDRDLDPLQKGFALLLITDLSALKEFKVVERIKLQALVEELGLGASGLVTPSAAPRTGKLLAARWLVGGEISGDQTKLAVQSPVVEVASAKVLGQPVSRQKLSELFRIEKELLFGVVKLLKIRPTREEELRLRKPCSTNTNALVALFKGVDASDRGDYDGAAAFYQQALDEDPGVCLAADALDELEDLGLVVAKNKSKELLQALRDTTSLTNQLTPKDELRYQLTPKDVPAGTTIQLVFPPTP